MYGDDQFSGVIHEFRIWNGAVSPLYIAVAAAAGPSVVATNLAPQSLTVTVTNSAMTAGLAQPASVVGNFSGASGVAVTSFVTNWTSSNPSVLTVDGNGMVTAVNTGSASVSATINGVTGTSALISVAPSKPIVTRQPPASQARLAGGSLNATVENIGSPPFVYRWFRNDAGHLVSSAATGAFTLSNLLTSDAGSYFCVISNQYGMATSSILGLTIVQPTRYEQGLLAFQPAAYWPLAETSGAVARDLVGGVDGVYVGGCALGHPGPAPTMFGGGSRAVEFDGSSAYVDIPGGAFNFTGPLTAMAWVRVLTTPGFAGVFGHGDASWRMTVNNFGQPGASDGNAPDATSAASIEDGNWHMLAYVYSGPAGSGNGQLYVDGELAAAQDVGAAPAGDNLDVWIGGAPDYGSGRLINADFAHAAVFAQALSSDDIADLYAGIYPRPVRLSVALAGAEIKMTWPAGTLLQASNVRGPWTAITSAVSPYTAAVGPTNQFFQLLVNP